jgi:hypothetical protein
MPRDSTKTEEENVDKKTPRKRAASRKNAGAKTAADKTAPKKTAVKKSPRKAAIKSTTPAKKSIKKETVLEESTEVETQVTEVAATIKKRKAPTVFSSEAAKKRAVKTQVIVMGVLLTIGVGASAAVGFNDSSAGQINVEETIKEQNARMANMVDVDGPTVVVPASNRVTIPDAGLIPSANQTKQASPSSLVSSSSSTATSTDSVATSTDDGTEAESQLDVESPPVNTDGGSAVDTETTTVTAIEQNESSETE